MSPQSSFHFWSWSGGQWVCTPNRGLVADGEAVAAADRKTMAQKSIGNSRQDAGYDCPIRPTITEQRRHQEKYWFDLDMGTHTKTLLVHPIRGQFPQTSHHQEGR